MSLPPPFPYFGNKSRVAALVWSRLGGIRQYVEPFAGTLAVLLHEPASPSRQEVVNDKDAFISNYFRAIQHDPEAVFHYADWPTNENDLHARHAWLVGQRASLTPRIEGDPEYYDAKIAGWWVWGIVRWLGSGWCSGRGPWRVRDGQLLKLPADAQGEEEEGIPRQKPHICPTHDGVIRRIPSVRNVPRVGAGLRAYCLALSERLRNVAVFSGDWKRVVSPCLLQRYGGVTGVFLDPPYLTHDRSSRLYLDDDASADKVALEVREWALAHGDDPSLRIVLCGYEGHFTMPPSWTCVPWRAPGGYALHAHGRGRSNAARERLYFSPHCLPGDLHEYSMATVASLHQSSLDTDR